jgi:GNAT superfamily N-acetyltransferase
MKNKLKILGVGHPRTGSKFLQVLLNSWGFSVFHEGNGLDGIVSWQFATESDPPLISYRKDTINQNITPKNYKFETIIYHVRDPYFSIPSIAFTETYSLNFRSEWGKFDISENILETTLKSILSWDELVQQKNPDIIFRIEYDYKKLYDFLFDRYSDKISWSNKEVGKPHNIRIHKGWNDLLENVKTCDTELLSKINNYCIKYGYMEIFNTEKKELIRKNNENSNLRIVKNIPEYFEYIRYLRTHQMNLIGFIEMVDISSDQQIEYMSKYGDCYEICLSGETPVGFVGVVDNDIRFAVEPNFHGKGVGKYMIMDLIHKNPQRTAKVKHDNLASIKVFESCGFKLYNKDDVFLYYSL